MLLYRRLGAICARMERLVVRFQTGRLRQVSARASAAGRTAADAVAGVVPRQVLPRRFGWLVRLASYHAAGYGSQLQTVLGQPEMVELLLAAPQAARILRPLCRMLAVETSLLRPRRAGEAAALAPLVNAGEEVASPVRPRVRVARKAIDWGRIPLPRGVLSAARRQGVHRVLMKRF